MMSDSTPSALATNTLRVAIVSQYFWPENFRINDLVGELILRGHRVTILTGTPNYPEGKTYPAFKANRARFSRFQGAEVIRVPVVPRGKRRLTLALNYISFAISGSLLAPFRLRGRRFDVILVFQTSPITAALPAILLRRLNRTPLFLWILDLWPDTLAAIGAVRSPHLLSWIGSLVGFIYRRSDRILVSSRAFIDNVVKYSGRNDRIEYFPGWAEPLFDVPEVADAPTVLAPFADNFVVMFAGNLGWAQDLPAIVDAADRLRGVANLRWIIVGEGSAAAEAEEDAERRGLCGQVRFVGRHPLEQMPAFFAAADALLVSLKAEPIWAQTVPGKVQSYLAAGRPILGMLDGEGARVIEASGGGLVGPAGDSKALSENVLRLIALSDVERAEMGARGRSYGRAEFDRRIAVDKFEAWVRESHSDLACTAAPVAQ